MRFLQWLRKYMTPGIGCFSIAFGALTFLPMQLLSGWEWPYVLLYSLLMAVGMMTIMPFALWWNDRKYRDVDTALGTIAKYSGTASIRYRGKTRAARLFFMGDSFALYSREGKESLELHYDRKATILLTDSGHIPTLRIVTPVEEDGCEVTMPNPVGLIAMLRSSGWDVRG